LRAGAFHAASRGVTTLGFVSCGARELAALIELEEELPLRVMVYLNPERDVLKAFKRLRHKARLLGATCSRSKA
jgi:hypothetical protein